jgi:eukaryotic-like serine/threonine-protein kinase
MNQDVMTLFRQVAELPQAERADHYARQQVPDALRDEVESLLRYNWTTGGAGDTSSTERQRLDEPATGTTPRVHRTASPPTRIGRFEVERLIGRGGMGDVYLARDPVIDRPVAIKLIGNAVENETARRRLVREARTAGRLRHPNIVTIFESGEHEQQPFIAMEYVPGETLRHVIGRREPMSMRRRLEMIEGACAGLAHAHRAGVVHLDIKPDNLILDETGIVKVLDFGISRNAHADTLTAHVAGTLRYMSPEQIQGQAFDHRSDTFSLGCALFELLSYEPAFSGSTSEIVTRIANGPVPRLADLMPGIDPELDRIVSRAMAIEPEMRYADLEELREELATVRFAIDPATDTPEPARAGVGGMERPPSRARQSSAARVTRWRPGTAVKVVGAGAAAVVVAGVVLSLRGPAPAPSAAEETRRPVEGRVSGPAPVAPAATAPAVASSAGTDEVWRLLARGERAAVLARLDASHDAALGRAVVDTVRATVTRARDAAAAGAGSATYQNGDGQMERATRLASDGRSADALRALWQAADLFARSSPPPPAATAALPPAPQPSAPSPSVSAALPATQSPAPDAAAPQAPAAATPPPLSPSTTERPAVANVPPATGPSANQAVLETLQRYDAAYEALNIGALLRVFPSLSTQEKQLRQTFEGVTSYESDTRATRVDLAGDTATVQATVARRISRQVGGGAPFTNESAMEFRLRRVGGEWVILSATAR